VALLENISPDYSNFHKALVLTLLKHI